MGNGASKLNHHVKEALHRPRRSAGGAAKKGSAPRVAAQRPPTPEYHKEEDAKSAPTIDTLVSPVSPAPSAGSPKAPAAEPAAPSQSASSTPKAPQAASITKPTLPPTPQGLHATSSLQDLINDVRSAANSQPASRQQSPALDGAESARTHRGPDGGQTPASRRASSAARSEMTAGPMDRPRRHPADDPRLVYSETQGYLYRGRDGTLYPEMVVTREPDPRALYFPRQTDRLAPPGTIFPAAALKESHFNCYLNHRNMNRRPNRNYPLTCQTCRKADSEDRWLCGFCQLRICEMCMRTLDGHQRVLRRLMDELAANTPLSLSSASRPPSSRAPAAGAN
ncbi:hypothetical protein CDD82_2192 [Ophiocordyceps australis]|uniref:Uncharacterized protein n=1 Tax=Ophiocordyceps australis TaxID=1399860 RepID=A0A2C5ZCX2_9HYPO|nr:hypothetical protein CDD82_2192 [Ophiocordyceps australis]